MKVRYPDVERAAQKEATRALSLAVQYDAAVAALEEAIREAIRVADVRYADSRIAERLRYVIGNGAGLGPGHRAAAPLCDHVKSEKEELLIAGRRVDARAATVVDLLSAFRESYERAGRQHAEAYGFTGKRWRLAGLPMAQRLESDVPALVLRSALIRAMPRFPTHERLRRTVGTLEAELRTAEGIEEPERPRAAKQKGKAQ